MKTTRVPSILWTALKVLVTGGLITWLVVRFDWEEVFYALRTVPVGIIIFGGAALAVGQLIAALRLNILLNSQEIRIGYLRALRLNLIGLFASNYLPSTVGGDALKLAMIAREGHSKTTTLATLAADRLTSMITMLFFLPFIFLLGRELQLDVNVGIFLVAAIGLGILIVGSVLLLGRLNETIQVHNEHLVFRWYVILKDILSRMILAFKLWIEQPAVLGVAVLLSLATFLVGYFSGWVLISQGAGADIKFVEWIAVSVVMYFLILLPISINGLGLQEAGLVFVLPLMGVSPEASLLYAVLIRLLQLLLSIPGGFLLWVGKKQVESET
jgi:glycosyltransferase 2 family protein